MLPVMGELLTAFRSVTKQLRFLGNHCYVMKLGILESKGEQPSELVGAAAHQGNIVILANTCHMNRPELYSKIGPMG